MLKRIAINREVVAAVSNSYTISPDGSGGMLRMWIDGMRRAGVKNYMVICIDDQVAEIMKRLDVPYWRKVKRRILRQAFVFQHSSRYLPGIYGEGMMPTLRLGVPGNVREMLTVHCIRSAVKIMLSCSISYCRTLLTRVRGAGKGNSDRGIWALGFQLHQEAPLL